MNRGCFAVALIYQSPLFMQNRKAIFASINHAKRWGVIQSLVERASFCIAQETHGGSSSQLKSVKAALVFESGREELLGMNEPVWEKWREPGTGDCYFLKNIFELQEFPPDLMSVDVSAFASLIMYQSSV